MPDYDPEIEEDDDEEEDGSKDFDYWVVDPDEWSDDYEVACLELEVDLLDKLIELVGIISTAPLEDEVVVLNPKHKIELSQLLSRTEKSWYYNEKLKRVK